MNNYDTLKNIPVDNLDTIRMNFSLVGVENIMAGFPSKTFKVNPMFRMMYHSCIDVVSEKKTPLTEALLEKEIGKDNVLALQLYEFNDLIEKMIYDLKKELNTSSYDDVLHYVRTHDRYIEMLRAYQTKNTINNLVMFSVRIPQVIVEEVYKLKRTTLGEVIELSIGLYIVTCSDTIFTYTLLAFKQL